MHIRLHPPSQSSVASVRAAKTIGSTAMSPWTSLATPQLENPQPWNHLRQRDKSLGRDMVYQQVRDGPGVHAPEFIRRSHHIFSRLGTLGSLVWLSASVRSQHIGSHWLDRRSAPNPTDYSSFGHIAAHGSSGSSFKSCGRQSPHETPVVSIHICRDVQLPSPSASTRGRRRLSQQP